MRYDALAHQSLDRAAFSAFAVLGLPLDSRRLSWAAAARTRPPDRYDELGVLYGWAGPRREQRCRREDGFSRDRYIRAV